MIRSDKEELQHLVMIVVVAVMAIGIAIGIVVYVKDCREKSGEDACKSLITPYKAKHEFLNI